MPVTLVIPLMFINYEQPYDKNDLFIAIAQSGKSTATIDEEISPLFMVIPFQLTAYLLSIDLGIDLTRENSLSDDIFKFSQKEKTEQNS